MSKVEVKKLPVEPVTTANKCVVKDNPTKVTVNTLPYLDPIVKKRMYQSIVLAVAEHNQVVVFH